MKILLSTFLLISAVASFAGNLGFSQMEDGDRIELTEHSTGCFHNSTSYYEVRMSAGSHFFRQYEIVWDKTKRYKILEKKLIGEIQLTAADIRGLDGLLKFYRSPKEASSTTQASLLVEYFEQGVRLKAEQLKDESGGYGLEDRKEDVITLYRLAQRTKENSGAAGLGKSGG